MRCLNLALPNAGATDMCVETHFGWVGNLAGFPNSLYSAHLFGSRKPKSEAATQRTPFGYNRILLASPVLSRSMALPKSFIETRSVMTGCKFSLPLFSRAVIWYQV